jgi:hypothetical protein
MKRSILIPCFDGVARTDFFRMEHCRSACLLGAWDRVKPQHGNTHKEAQPDSALSE